MDFLSIPTLTGALATLDPLAPEDVMELAEAVAEKDLYKVWYTRLPVSDIHNTPSTFTGGYHSSRLEGSNQVDTIN